jgi:hypothetical protein
MALGLPIGMNSRRVTEYRKMGEELGFSLGSPFESFGTKTAHIDFVQGIVVDVLCSCSYLNFTLGIRAA